LSRQNQRIEGTFNSNTEVHRNLIGFKLRRPRSIVWALGLGQRSQPGGGRPLGSADPSLAQLPTTFCRGGACEALARFPAAFCSLPHPKPTFHTYIRRERGPLIHHHSIHSNFKSTRIKRDTRVVVERRSFHLYP